jgi:hypothetical protein
MEPLGSLKKYAARANGEFGQISKSTVDLIVAAAAAAMLHSNSVPRCWPLPGAQK